MSQEDFSMFAFLAALTLASSVSAYLWFVRKLRFGVLIWTLYCIRALCGLLSISVAVMGWGILIEAADVPAVLVFVGPIGFIGLLSVIPWGLRSINFR